MCIKKQMYYANYIIKVLRERDFYYNEKQVRMFVLENIENDKQFEKAKYILKASTNWSSFRKIMEKEFKSNF